MIRLSPHHCRSREQAWRKAQSILDKPALRGDADRGVLWSWEYCSARARLWWRIEWALREQHLRPITDRLKAAVRTNRP